MKTKIGANLPRMRERIERLKREFGNFRVGEVTVDQIYSGIRGVQISVSDISYVDPAEGIRLRGYTIQETLDQLPKLPGTKIPMAGGLYFLLMVDEMPSYEEAVEVEDEWRERNKIPGYVFDVINAMPLETHPMTMFSQAILALQADSIFAKRYYEGISKPAYWGYFLEDSLNLTAKLPGIAAYIYNRKYRQSEIIEPNPNLDWSANFAHMIGRGGDAELMEMLRLYFVIHSDHEGANVSAHASHLVCSALSDIYLSCSAGMNGLAGPLHGLANQECLRWLIGVRDYFGGIPPREALEDYIVKQLKEGRTIPGYGHAVLRTTDPRFSAQLKFAEQYAPDDELIRLVKLVYSVVPDLLQSLGKVKNPWPNVDAINGAMLHHYGITQHDFYTVLFGVSRILGLTSHAVWARGLYKPIERPKSLTTKMLEEMFIEAGMQPELTLNVNNPPLKE